MVTERTQEDKPTKQAQGSRTVSVALSGEHADRMRRVSRAYGLEPDELVAYFLEREENPLPVGCVQCRAGADRIAILNRRITTQRHELSRLNRAIQRNAFGRSKVVEQRAIAAMASFDRLLALLSPSVTRNLEVDLELETVLAARRILARFIKRGFPGWDVLFAEDRIHQVRFAKDVLPAEELIEW